MVTALILAPIVLSILATQYESCKFIKKDCIQQNVLSNRLLDEVVCGTGAAVYKDVNSGKCYGFTEQLGSSPPPSNANLVWIGSGRNK